MKQAFVIPAIISYLLFCTVMLPFVMASVAWMKAVDRFGASQTSDRSHQRSRVMAAAFRKLA
jgi:hypothetical protein